MLWADQNLVECSSKLCGMSGPVSITPDEGTRSRLFSKRSVHGSVEARDVQMSFRRRRHGYQHSMQAWRIFRRSRRGQRRRKTATMTAMACGRSCRHWSTAPVMFRIAGHPLRSLPPSRRRSRRRHFRGLPIQQMSAVGWGLSRSRRRSIQVPLLNRSKYHARVKRTSPARWTDDRRM
jgi:hypothetical protein